MQRLMAGLQGLSAMEAVLSLGVGWPKAEPSVLLGHLTSMK